LLWGFSLRRSTFGTSAEGHVSQTLYQGTDATTIRTSFPSTFNDSLLRLVQPFGDQVLCNLCGSFLCCFCTTCGHCAANLAGDPVGQWLTQLRDEAEHR
jgi:hypothetical protein